jgi:hypothetical protein
MGDVSGIAARVRRATLEQPPTLGDGDCEALRPGLLGQPVNTVSSLAYVAAGAQVAARSVRAPSATEGGALAYAAFAALAGVGSVAYHGPQFPGAQTMHDLPILGVAGIGAGVPLWRAARGRRTLPGWSTRRGITLAASMAVAGIAYVTGSTSSRCCRPRSLLQPHALWHVGTAVAMATWAGVVWPPEDPDDAVVIDLTDRGLLPDRRPGGDDDAADDADGADRADR